MVRVFNLFIALLISPVLTAQDGSNPLNEYKKMIKATATISPGFMLNNKQTNIYIHGHIEFFPESKISLRGDAFWFVGAQEKPQLFNGNSMITFGAAYHLRKNRFDVAFGLQPGVMLTQPNSTMWDTFKNLAHTYYQVNYNYTAVPVISPYVGLTFYPGKYVNFFAEVRYNNGKYFSYTNGTTLFLSEIKISAGLGFQIPYKKNS